MNTDRRPQTSRHLSPQPVLTKPPTASPHHHLPLQALTNTSNHLSAPALHPTCHLHLSPPPPKTSSHQHLPRPHPTTAFNQNLPPQPALIPPLTTTSHHHPSLAAALTTTSQSHLPYQLSRPPPTSTTTHHRLSYEDLSSSPLTITSSHCHHLSQTALTTTSH